MTNWLNGCEICNTGIVKTIEEYKKDGLSVRKACEVMEKEAFQKFPELKEDLNKNRIRARYMRKMGSGTKRTSEKVKDDHSAPLYKPKKKEKFPPPKVLPSIDKYIEEISDMAQNLVSRLVRVAGSVSYIESAATESRFLGELNSLKNYINKILKEK